MKSTLISVEEYLHSSYEVDCDYVDGELVERNVGEKGHGRLQGAIYSYYYVRRRKTGIHPFIEQRLQVSATRFRVPDVCLTVGEPPEEIFTSAPLAVVEVLPPEDRISSMQTKIDDYIRMGVRYIWVIDPVSRRAYSHSSEGSSEIKDGILRTTDPGSELPLNEIFDEIDAD
ncbi:MAG: Uma2 family endonuclease [Acidobacteriota bacterium]|nr:Uma2 family endonuclease [Acidobacteriota bacterium]